MKTLTITICFVLMLVACKKDKEPTATRTESNMELFEQMQAGTNNKGAEQYDENRKKFSEERKMYAEERDWKQWQSGDNDIERRLLLLEIAQGKIEELEEKLASMERRIWNLEWQLGRKFGGNWGMGGELKFKD